MFNWSGMPARWRALWTAGARPASGRTPRLARCPAHRVGADGEAAAEAYLRGLGYRILDRSARFRAGEIDLVAECGGAVVFVEVKARTGTFAAPESAVDRGKRRRVERAALAWLRRARREGSAMRFDVIALDGRGLRHIPGAW